MSKVKTTAELDVHRNYVASLLKENNIEIEEVVNQIYIFGDRWCDPTNTKKEDLACIKFQFDHVGIAYLQIASKMGIFGGWMSLALDDLSDPKSYHWLMIW
jgi:hypothetical protein